MRTRARKLSIVATIAALSLASLSGCVITNMGNPLDAITGATPTPTPGPNSVAVTDEWGTYTRITAAENGGVASLAADASPAERARAWTVDFIMSETLDSIALDSASGWQTWVSEVAPNYFDAKALKEIARDGKRPILSAPDIARVTNHLARNGGSRWETTTITKGETVAVRGNRNTFVIRAEGNGVAPLESGSITPTFVVAYTVTAHGDGWRITKWSCTWDMATTN